jgi:hypothetical protein
MTLKFPAVAASVLSLLASLAVARANQMPQAPAELQAAFDHVIKAHAEPSPPTATTIVGRDGFLFLASELRHLSVGPFWGEHAAAVSRAANPAFADPLPAILDFHQQLQALGIEMLLVPVPPKAVIYPDMLPGDPPISDALPMPRLDVHLQQFYALLREQGVQVLDLTPTFLAERAVQNVQQPLYCRTDTHWSPRAMALAAEAISGHVHRRLPPGSLERATLQVREQTISIRGDLLHALPAADHPPAETLTLRVLERAAVPDPTSPVLLLGDSHNLVFHAGGDMHAAGAGLIDLLAADWLEHIPDLIAVRGSGATPARINLIRRARADAEYLANKRLVIWLFTAREFTEADAWRPLPVLPR